MKAAVNAPARRPSRKYHLALGAFLLLAAACGDTCKAREREIPQYDLELQVWQQIKEKGKYTPAVFCPGPLDARVGAEITCYMMIKGEPYDVHVVVSAVDGTKVEYDIEVADQPRDAGATSSSSSSSTATSTSSSSSTASSGGPR